MSGGHVGPGETALGEQMSCENRTLHQLACVCVGSLACRACRRPELARLAGCLHELHTHAHEQDVIHQACASLQPPIAPIGRFFFGLKDIETHCYISPYLPVPPGNQRYQLRVFVSPAQSNFQFQMVSRSLLNYYYQQVSLHSPTHTNPFITS